MQPTFKAWIAAHFGQSGEQLRWLGADGSPVSNAPSRLMVGYLTRLFENAGELLSPYTDEQVGDGLNRLFRAEIHALEDTTVLQGATWNERARGLRAMYELFKQCFAPRCSPVLSHNVSQKVYPLNGVCFMWWDIYPAHGLARHYPNWPEGAEEDTILLETMERILRLDAVACQESALHGLNHWFAYYPERVKQTIDAFLEAAAAIPPELERYALQAREGRLQ